MGLFDRKREEDYEGTDEFEAPKRIKNIKLRKVGTKEISKPWGKYERIFVLIAILLTVGTSGFLSLRARNFKLPNTPSLKISFNRLVQLNPFREQTIVIGNGGTAVDLKKIESIKNTFTEMVSGYSGIYAFYIYDLNGGYYYGLNHQEKMQAASLIKLPVMYLAIKNDEDTNLISVMGKKSDNQAFVKMVSILGKKNISQTIYNDLGMSKTSIDKNETTPEEIGLFFKKLYNNEILNKEKSRQFMDYLTNTNFEKWLRAGIPEEVIVSHKYGREERSVNDAGIIFSKKPFIMVIMTDGVIEKDADQLFPKLTKMLYDKHTEDN